MNKSSLLIVALLLGGCSDPPELPNQTTNQTPPVVPLRPEANGLIADKDRDGVADNHDLCSTPWVDSGFWDLGTFRPVVSTKDGCPVLVEPQQCTGDRTPPTLLIGTSPVIPSAPTAHAMRVESAVFQGEPGVHVSTSEALQVFEPCGAPKAQLLVTMGVGEQTLVHQCQARVEQGEWNRYALHIDASDCRISASAWVDVDGADIEAPKRFVSVHWLIQDGVGNMTIRDFGPFEFTGCPLDLKWSEPQEKMTAKMSACQTPCENAPTLDVGALTRSKGPTTGKFIHARPVFEWSAPISLNASCDGLIKWSARFDSLELNGAAQPMDAAVCDVTGESNSPSVTCRWRPNDLNTPGGQNLSARVVVRALTGQSVVQQIKEIKETL